MKPLILSTVTAMAFAFVPEPSTTADFASGRTARTQTAAHGATGASVGTGQMLRVSATIADNLIAAGYQIHIDALIEDRRDYPRIAVLTLGQQTSVSGRGLIRTLSVN